MLRLIRSGRRRGASLVGVGDLVAFFTRTTTSGGLRLRRGLEEDAPVYSADHTGGGVLIIDGPFVETKEWLGGFAVVNVADDEAAKLWAGKLAGACGWPQEVRRFGRGPQAE